MSEEPYPVPDGWIWSTLGEICEKPQYGWTTRAVKEGAGPKLLRTTDISSGRIDWNKVPYCSKVPDDEKKYLLSKGDIVVSRAGSVGLSIEIEEHPPKAIFASYLIRLRPIDPIPAKFVSLFLRSPYYWSQIVETTSGISIPNINASKLQELKIPLVPLVEQKRIVMKLENALIRVSSAKRVLQHAQSLIKRFRVSVLAKAFRGELTTRDPNDEPAEKLLERIRQERRKNWEKEIRAKGRDPRKYKYEEPHLVETRDFEKLPEGWVWTSFGEIIQVKSGHAFKFREYSEGGARLLKINNVSFGRISWEEEMTFLPENYVNSYPDIVLKEGDILLALNRPILHGELKSGMVTKDDLPAILYQRVGRLDIVDPKALDRQYLFLFTRTEEFRDHIADRLFGTDQPYVNPTRMIDIPIPLAPQVEQRRIVTKINALFSRADTIEKALQAASENAKLLEQFILARAFQGELVPQDPNDEPASVLLEKIRVQRTAMSRKGRPQTVLEFAGHAKITSKA